MDALDASRQTKRELYTYESKTPLYALAASQRAGTDFNFRFAVGSFIEEYNNRVEVRTRVTRHTRACVCVCVCARVCVCVCARRRPGPQTFVRNVQRWESALTLHWLSPSHRAAGYPARR
jgi:hypothetical protein